MTSTLTDDAPDRGWEQVVELDRRGAENTLEMFHNAIKRYGAAYAVRRMGEQVTRADLTLRFVRHYVDSRENHGGTVREAIAHALGSLDCSPSKASMRFVGSNYTDRFDVAVHHEEFRSRMYLWDRYRTGVPNDE